MPRTDTLPPTELLSPARLEHLRGPMGGGRMLTASECRELANAYELAARLLEAVVREDRCPPGSVSPTSIRASDVAWLKLRDAER